MSGDLPVTRCGMETTDFYHYSWSAQAPEPSQAERGLQIVHSRLFQRFLKPDVRLGNVGTPIYRLSLM
jgi:hypothetical protein